MTRIDEKALEAAIAKWERFTNNDRAYGADTCLREAITAYLDALPVPTEEEERGEFEAMAREKGYGIARSIDGNYCLSHTDSLHTGWQARAKAFPAPAMVDCECPLTYRALVPEEHVDSCPVVEQRAEPVNERLLAGLRAAWHGLNRNRVVRTRGLSLVSDIDLHAMRLAVLNLHGGVLRYDETAAEQHKGKSDE